MPTLRAAAELLLHAGSIVGLAPLAAHIGCAGDVAPLDADACHRLGLDEQVLDAHIATGTGALRALLLVIDDGCPMREHLPRLAGRLATRAPHVLWIIIATQRERGDIAVAAWSGERRFPRVVALLANRARVVDSDADTVRALAAAVSARDILTHSRWVEVLGRDALSNRFYRILEGAVRVLADSSAIGSNHDRREAALLHTSRLLFLSFLEAKGWLDGDGAFLAHAFEQCASKGGHFHDRVLRPLFFGTLNTPLRDRAPVARAFGRIPFLNGGLFSRTPLERSLKGLAFSDDAYGALLYDVFGQFRFTSHEENASWSEAAVDPEMLGRAFESLMTAPERGRTGAFYTPFALVERVASAALETVDLDTVAALEQLTILDPACGSGAFLVHLLERLTSAAVLLGDRRDAGVVRREILTRSIFGVDVNPTAVWLCQLRLWLSVVIESSESDPLAVVPLPNLDRNIRVGDSLSGHAFGEVAGAGRGSLSLGRLRERYTRATGKRKDILAGQLDREERARCLAVVAADASLTSDRRRDLLAARRGRDLFGERYGPSRDERDSALTLRARAAALRLEHRRIAAGGALPFSFPVYFADVAARGGFQLVVGNPPWVRLHRIVAEQRVAFRRDFDVARSAAWEAGAGPSGAGRGFSAQVDVAALFVERSIHLLAADGGLALLLPAKLWQSLAGGGVRAFVDSRLKLCRIEDYTAAPAVFDAAVYPSLITGNRRDRNPERDSSCVQIAVHHRGHDAYTWSSSSDAVAYDDSPGAPWILLPPDARSAFNQLRALGQPLASTPIGRPHLGVKSGCNDAFVVELVDIRGDIAEVVTSQGVAATIERSLIRPLLRGERLARWRLPQSYDSIIWTHDDTDAPLPSLPPLATRLLAPWRRTLAARTDARRSARWWSLFRTESARPDVTRVVWGDVGREPRASVLRAGDQRVPLNSCYVARCRDETDAYALTALLNGPLARAWLDALAEPARGGYRRYLGWTMALLPIPTDWNRARDILAPLGAAAAEGHTPSEMELLDHSLRAYGMTHATAAPLVAWFGP